MMPLGKKGPEVDPDGEILQLLAEILNRDFGVEEEVGLSTKFEELEMDDLDVTEFVLAVEDEMDIRFPSTEYDTIGDMVRDAVMSRDGDE